MSRVEYVRCDMCGRLVADTDARNCGHLYRDAEGWRGGCLDLCEECADEVQRLISHGPSRGEERGEAS